jgi:L-amino acid N-acyltransferase YncA
VATPGPPILVRPATLADAGAIVEIYNREVTGSTATFDLVERTLDEQRGTNSTDAPGVIPFSSPWEFAHTRRRFRQRRRPGERKPHDAFR